jgi:DNA polymerase I-like protein with 3'-5' exonuclease and polymerase domains
MLPSFLNELNPEIYLSDNYVVVDFEVDTSHGDYGNPVHPDNAILLARWKVGKGHKDFGTVREIGRAWGGDYSRTYEPFRDAVATADYVVAHQAKYELGWMIRLGIDISKVLVFDTKLAEYVLLGNMAAGDEHGTPKLSTGLDMACRRRGLPIKDPVVDIMIHNQINPVRIPQGWLEGRCAQDVETTELVFLDQRQSLLKRGLLPVQFTRCLLTPVLASIEREGMGLDLEKVEDIHVVYSLQLADQQQKMDLMTGGINWRSNPQAAAFIYDKLGFPELQKRGMPDRTSTGKRRTDKKTLDKLAAIQKPTKEQAEFLELRKAIGKTSAAMSKSLDFYLGVVREYGGTFYAEIHQSKTATHRLSSTGIPLAFTMYKGDKKSAQFQNQPRIFKKLFRAKRPGWLMGEADGSSLEFRVAAELGGPDVDAMRDIESGWDVHSFTASILHDTTIEKVKAEKKQAEAAGRDDWRQLAKPDTFKPLYGGTKGTAAQERYYAAFRLRYPGITKAQDDWLHEVVLHKRLITPWGLRYYWPTARKARSGWVNVTSAVYNYPIQALATAEIIPIALVYFWHRLKEFGLEGHCYIVNTVHDSVAVEVEPGYEDAFRELAKQAFTTDVYGYLKRVYGMDFHVPLGVGLKVGTHWGTGDEQQWNIYPDGRNVRVK